ncbi:MAG: hypothetical protein NVSMB57_10100 [Actinomycetota bacterium]
MKRERGGSAMAGGVSGAAALALLLAVVHAGAAAVGSAQASGSPSVGPSERWAQSVQAMPDSRHATIRTLASILAPEAVPAASRVTEHSVASFLDRAFATAHTTLRVATTTLKPSSLALTRTPRKVLPRPVKPKNPNLPRPVLPGVVPGVVVPPGNSDTATPREVVIAHPPHADPSPPSTDNHPPASPDHSHRGDPGKKDLNERKDVHRDDAPSGDANPETRPAQPTHQQPPPETHRGGADHSDPVATQTHDASPHADHVDRSGNADHSGNSQEE